MSRPSHSGQNEPFRFVDQFGHRLHHISIWAH